MRLDSRVATNVDAELVHELVQRDDGGVLEVVREGQRHVHLQERETTTKHS